ncbi:unnamed protein product [Diplocarpon coronariae]
MAPDIPEKCSRRTKERFQKAVICNTDGMVADGIMRSRNCCQGRVCNQRVSAWGSGVLCKLTYHRCGECGNCTEPEPGSCKNVGGYLGEVFDGRECCLLPDNMRFQSAAPLACAGVMNFVLIGAGGGLGYLKVQFAKALGLHAIAINARNKVLALAKDCGADAVFDARKGKGDDATLNLSEHENTVAIGAAVTKMHDLLVQITQLMKVSVPFEELIFRDIRIQGRGECQKMREFVSKHNSRVKSNAFSSVKEVPKAVELAH